MSATPVIDDNMDHGVHQVEQFLGSARVSSSCIEKRGHVGDSIESAVASSSSILELELESGSDTLLDDDDDDDDATGVDADDRILCFWVDK